MNDQSNRQVVFVGGTPYSGSTFFDMILGNDPEGFSAGELRLLFNPMEPYHVGRTCSCGDSTCDLWQRMLPHGQDRVFQAIFGLRPDVRFIVDSSKSVFWIARQAELLAKAGISTKHILIWKSPEEIYVSMKRRGRSADWHKAWVNYHLLYFSVLTDWRAIPYSAMARDPDALRAVCDWVNIPYFDGKEEYWHKTQHIFGGNRTSRFHLHADAAARRELQGTFDEERMRFHRKIYYSTSEASDVQIENLLSDRELATLQAVSHALQDHDVRTKPSAEPSLPKMSPAMILARRWKSTLDQAIGRWKYGVPRGTA